MLTIFKKALYKKLNKELDDLIGFFENRSEAMACLGDEYIEDENIDEISERLDYVYDKSEKLRKILKL